MIDFNSLADDLLSSAKSHLCQWFPAGKFKGPEFVVGDLSGSEGDSLSINWRTGKWKDFASGDAGGDLISLYAAMHGMSQLDAAKALGGEDDGKPRQRVATAPKSEPEPPKRKVIAPVTDFYQQLAPEKLCLHPKFGKPSAVWEYLTVDSLTLGYIARYDPPGERKQIVPWTYSDSGWGMGQWNDPRPMYGLQRLAANNKPVLLVEGEKAADAAHSICGHVYAVLTWPGGAQAWKKVDWTPIAGRKVLLWPDNDEPGTNAMLAIALAIDDPVEIKVINVDDMADGWDAADALAEGMDWAKFREWAKPRVQLLKSPNPEPPTPQEPPPPPPPPEGSKPKRQKPDLQVVGNTALKPEPEFSDDMMIYSSMPMKTAELFMEKLPEGRIMHWRGEFYSWDGMRYVVRDKVHVQQRLYNFTATCFTLKINPKTGDGEVVPFSPKRNAIEDIEHAMRAVSYMDIPEPQCWIEKLPDDPPAGEIIAFRNGFLHWPTRRLLPSTDRLFVTSALDFDYNEHAPEPTRWVEFLNGLWPDDPESIQSLADMFGYLLTDDTSQQKMFMFIGPPRSGKGTILRVLESLVGYSNRVSPSLSSIGTQFGLQPLIGKRLAMISDARLSGRADQQPIVENMLRISGEDALSIDRKNISAWTGKLPTRFVLASNELPSFSDASAALANRFIIFKFTQSFLGREDMGLTGKLLQELPSIVLWALDGLERLQERGYLIRPASSNDLSEDMIEQTSPIMSFVSDRCLVGAQYSCDRDELYKEWKEWCEAQGRDHPGTKVHFGRQISAAFPSVKRSQPRNLGTGKNDDHPVPRARLNLYEGIRIRSMFDN